MPFVTSLGNGGIIWIAISLIFISDKYKMETGILMIYSLILTTIAGEGIIKHIIKRARPFVQDFEKKLLIVKPVTYSFPSGHTSSSFAAAGILFSMQSKLSLFAIVLASLIAFSRIYLNVHYPTDVIMGMILGILCSQVVMAAYKSGFILGFDSLLKQLICGLHN